MGSRCKELILRIPQFGAHSIHSIGYIIWRVARWGQHLWARGYFCAVGAVDEQTIKAYIENQTWDEDDQGFKITEP